MTGIGRADRLLASFLGCAIDGERTHGIIFNIGVRLSPIEHIVRRQLHQWDACANSRLSHGGRSKGVDTPGGGDVTFCSVDGRVGGGVDHS